MRSIVSLLTSVPHRRKIVDMSPAAIPTGQALRALRTGARISARTLAARAGMSHSHLVRLESGERTIPEPTLSRLIDALGQITSERVA